MKSIHATILTGLCSVVALAASAGVPADELTSLTGAEDRVITLKTAPGPLDNPLKGWCTYIDSGKINQPYSMFYQNVSWKELEPSEGRYEFAKWEARAWNTPETAGKQIVFRVYLDYPAKPSGIPDWLLAKGLKTTAYSDFGGGVSPDYSNPDLLAGLDRLIAVLGARYDHDPRVAFVELGTLGHWGEWHTYPRAELFASEQVQQRIIDDYRRAFPDKVLMARTASGYAGQQTWLGYHDDMFPADTDGSEDWKFLPLMRQSGRNANWRAAAIGGELEPGNADTWFGKSLDVTKSAIDAGHFTWLGPYSPAIDPNSSPEFLANCQEMVRRMGYQFALKSVRLRSAVYKGGNLQVEINGENQGVAPFYYPWPVELALISGDGTVAQTIPLDCDLRSWQPGPFEIKASSAVAVRPGRYTLAIGIVNPYLKAPGVKFANALTYVDGWTHLTGVTVTQ